MVSFKGAVAGAVLALSAFATSASADTLFQSIPDLTVAPDTNAWCSSCDGSYRVFDEFSVAADSTAETLTFAVQSDYNYPTDVSVFIYAGGTSDAPGSQIYSSIFAPGDWLSAVNTAFNTTLVTVNLGAVALNAGTTYVLSYYSPVNLGAPSYGQGSGRLYQADAGAIDGQSLAFAFNGNTGGVPEPGVWALMIVGFGGAGAMLRRRRLQAI
ncbi:PEPxxWA-CTERM sorting domain-containing protein [Phenylobacterium sp.]|uniref:PEPxxWA-CTERM sorting domain-containing protein n=1 Tax=Phenylobacterium sp. TaxID=1871053 RepID=UPI0025D8157F|nr:PEPxxWA-CTERM sorting domain-containing protein [Phenylobacterium sp.]MBX3484924.1 PEP-CTERM sorting domain-containing protein [Phenylobacterium sp.]